MNLLIDLSFGEEYIFDPHAVREAAGVDRLSDLRNRHVRELPAVEQLHTPAIRDALIFILRDSVRKREKLWLLPMTDEVHTEWVEWLDGEVLTKVGPKQEWLGQTITPYGISPLKLVSFLAQRARSSDLDFLQKSLHDIDGLHLTAGVYRQVVNAGVKVMERSKFVRVITTPKFIAYAVVLIYSALRALPVTFVKEFEGSLAVLWLIDLGTALPYTWGLITMMTARELWLRLVGIVVTVVTFLAPYLYFGAKGSNYPFHVIVTITLLIFITFAWEAYRVRADKHVDTVLRNSARSHRK
ncbi:hypothetical protein NXS08_06760 [Gleimia sp. 6138-11-ORH1]|uniref:hypothetical protein n=1 Tax=Gleimia sp. 6138-11-ORH1 TaxID=2973937 RepID=UPI0021679358|nr:hypothetical protein [Gleimia sp. 6138-11-ORH1]MCS4485164.1 hypothetical protein [Gleimia sp. 6138-11-ORH1]